MNICLALPSHKNLHEFLCDERADVMFNQRTITVIDVLRSPKSNRKAYCFDKPRLIDEWQKGPDVLNQAKDDLDFDYQFGKYMLTGRAWNPNIRSKTSIRSTPTRHFVDTSIACCSLGIGPKDLMNDLESFGLFFEDMAVRRQVHGLSSV